MLTRGVLRDLVTSMLLVETPTPPNAFFRVKVKVYVPTVRYLLGILKITEVSLYEERISLIFFSRVVFVFEIESFQVIFSHGRPH